MTLGPEDFPDADKVEQTDNTVRPEDGPQEVDGEPVSQDPDVVYE